MKKEKSGYYTNRHSCFLLQYHLVMVTKFRHPVLTGDVKDFLEQYMIQYFKDRDLPLSEINFMPDHVHILFDAPPQLNLAEFVNSLKSASSRMVRKNYAEALKPYYWKPYFWSLSYFIGCVSERTEEVVKQYIRDQKKEK